MAGRVEHDVVMIGKDVNGSELTRGSFPGELFGSSNALTLSSKICVSAFDIFSILPSESGAVRSSTAWE